MTILLFWCSSGRQFQESRTWRSCEPWFDMIGKVRHWSSCTDRDHMHMFSYQLDTLPTYVL